jgi:hypothetical protein
MPSFRSKLEQKLTINAVINLVGSNECKIIGPLLTLVEELLQ